MKNLAFLLFSLVGIFTLQSCEQKIKKSDIGEYFDNVADSLNITSEVYFAQGFDIYRISDITKIVIKNPVNQNITSEYFLVSNTKIKDKFNDNSKIIVTPLNRVAVFSGTQLSALIKTNLISKIVGVSEVDYINDSTIKALVNDGTIKELASNGEFYLETVLKVNPQVIFHSPYKSNESHPLAVTQINMIPFLDFKETSPLGRAEWIKFSLAFFDKSYVADSIFKQIVDQYSKYSSLVEDISYRPTVFSDKYFNGQWYVPGGKSYIAKLLKDSGADYLWKDDDGLASFPLDYEVVYKKAVHADYWRIVGSFNDKPSYEYLELENELYAHFDAFKNKRIIWCNAQTSSYFEDSPLEPHIVLADLIHCFHPDILPNYKPKYYKLLN